MCWERTSTPTPGWSARMRCAATSPSSVNVGGMRMSTIATSGCRCATSVRRSSALPTCPTIVKPASVSRRAIPWRMTGASSARRIRGSVTGDDGVDVRPVTGGAFDVQRAVEGFDAVAEADEAGPGFVGAADPVVADVDEQVSIGVVDLDADVRGVRVLADVGERLGGDEVGGGLDRGGEALGGRRDGDGDRCPPAECLQGGAEAFVGEHRGVDAACERAELVEGAVELVFGFGEQRLELGGVGGVPARETQREPDPEQPLLRSVVEVSLEAASFGVSGMDDAGPRGADLGELDAELGLEPRVREGQARGGGGGLDEGSVVEEGRVVDERGESLA